MTQFGQFTIPAVWHFSDCANHNSIRAHGLLSLAEMRKRGIEMPAPGGNQWSHATDVRKGLDKYVHLAFIDNHPMLYHARAKENRLHKVNWFEIDPSVILEDGVRFYNDVANKSEAQSYTYEEAQKIIDIEVLLSYQPWQNSRLKSRWFNAHKSEILVPDSISLEKIIDANTNIHNG